MTLGRRHVDARHVDAGVWTANTWTPNNHNTWNGCVMDRGYPASPSYLTVSGA